MMLQKKLDRAMEWLKNKNSDNNSKDVYDEENGELDHYDPRAEWLAEEGSNFQLEKGDLPALILSAFIVFSPILILLIIIFIWILRW